MLNSGFRGKRATDGTGAISAQTQSVQATNPVPKINSWAVTDNSYVAIDDTAATSGATIVVYGNNFVTNMTVYIGNISVAATYLDSTRITFTAPTLSNGTYVIYVITPQGAAALLTPGIIYSGFPTWSTSTYISTVTAINIQLLATGDAPLTYALQGGSTLPTGISLTSTGVLTGTATSVTTDSVFYFTVIVDDAQLQSTQQSITLTFQFGEPYFKYTTLLLNGETSVTPFISDASTNSFGLTIAGDTKPTKFTPYSEGYYSNYFDGTGDYLNIASNAAFAFGTSDFTIEFWAYPTVNARQDWIDFDSGGGYRLLVYYDGSNIIYYSSGARITGSAMTLNTWQHIAVVRNSGSTKLYINGSQSGSTYSDSINFLAQQLTIAKDNAGSTYVTGYMSNVRIVKGTAVYTATFTPPTSPLTAIANTSLLTCQSNRFIDISANAFAITVNGDVSISPNIPFIASSSYATYGSAYFDGTGDYLTTTGTAAGTGNLTYECWFYSTSLAVPQVIFTTRTGNTSDGFQCMLDTGGEFRVGYTNINFISSAVSLGKLNRWYHVAVTRSSGTVTLWIDGISIGTSGRADNLTSTAVGIGAGRDSAGANPVTGYISNLRFIIGTAVYTTAFTPPTSPLTAIANTSLLTLQYNGGATNQAIIDNGPFNNIITRVGNTSQGSFSPYSVTGWSLNFNRSRIDSTLTGKSPGTGSFTYELFFNVTIKEAVINNVATLFSTRGGGTGADGFDVQITTAGSVEIGTSGSILFTSSAGLVTNGVWYHLAIVRNGTTNWTVYLNGSSIGTIINSTNFTSTDFYMGVFGGNGNDWFKGYISNFRYTRTAVYTATFTTPTSPLTVIVNTEYLVCQSNRLVDNSPNNFTVTPVAVNGSSSIQAFSPFGSVSEATPISYSNYFDGTGDYLDVPAGNSALSLGTSDFTVEFWFYAGSTATKALIDCRNPDTGNAGFDISYLTPNKIRFSTSGIAYIDSTTTVTANTWYHIALTRTSNVFSMYINGTVDSTTYTGSSVQNFTNTNYRIGSGANGAFTGYISNVRIIKGTAVVPPASGPTTPLTAVANTSLLTCQSTTIVDNSVNNLTLTANGDTKPKQFNPFGYTAQINTIYTPSIHGGSAYFDGTGDYLSTPTNTALNFSTGDFTVEAWVYPNSLAADWFIISSTGSGGLFFGLAAGQGYGWGRTATAWDYRVAGYDKINQWQHIAVTRSGTSMRLFFNGTQIGTTQTISTAYNLGTTSTTIGSQGANYYLNGYISNLRVVKGTAIYTSNFLPPAQSLTNYSTTVPSTLLLNFDNGGIVDQHSTNVLETVGNAQLSTAVKKYGNASMYFDGTGDLLTIPNNPSHAALGTSDFTLELWFNQTVLNARDNYLISHRVGGYAPFLFWINSGGSLRYYSSSDLGSWGLANDIALGAISLNTWYHLAYTRSGSTFKVFLNGAQVYTHTSSATFTTATTALNIGGQVGGGDNFTGYIDDIRFTKGVARYTANFTAPTAAFIGR